MASTYYVKVYYTKQQQQQPEIRRFAVRRPLKKMIVIKSEFSLDRYITGK
jgi:hypothetical protein